MFWLEIWWDVVRHPNTPFLQLWLGSWVLTGRKMGWTAENHQKSWFLPRWTPAKSFSFFDHHCKGKVFTDIFYIESLFPTCLVWVLWLFELTQLVYSVFAKTGFSPEMTSKWRYRCAQPTAKDAVRSRIQWCLHWL